MDKQAINGVIKRFAWVENLEATMEAGYRRSEGFAGVELTPVLGVNIKSSKNAGNMVHLDKSGETTGRQFWAYWGTYALVLEQGPLNLRYGMQRVSNPFLESRDNRGVAPAFRGVSASVKLIPGANIDIGSFNGMYGRGSANVSGLRTNYGGVAFQRFTYAGLTFKGREDESVVGYVGKAEDVWVQRYLSITKHLASSSLTRLTGNATVYMTKETGEHLQGRIRNTSYSAAITAAGNRMSTTLSFQQVRGDQFFDYVAETWGITLQNALVIDYAAPHEKSIQLKNVFERPFGVAGLNTAVWMTFGWGADGQVNALRYGQPGHILHNLYWKNGRPIRGQHVDIGISPRYTVQSGKLKGAKVMLLAVAHRASDLYPDNSSREFKLTVDVPLRFP